MLSYQYRKSHCGDKTILRPSFLHNGTSFTGKMSLLYWIGAQNSGGVAIKGTPQLTRLSLPNARSSVLYCRIYRCDSTTKMTVLHNWDFVRFDISVSFTLYLKRLCIFSWNAIFVVYYWILIEERGVVSHMRAFVGIETKLWLVRCHGSTMKSTEFKPQDNRKRVYIPRDKS